MNTKKLAVVLVLSSSAAFAGMKTTTPVKIANGGVITSAYGALGAVRNSSDEKQYIGCTIYAFNVSAQPTVYCTAQDVDGRVFSCTHTSSAALAQVVSSIGPTSRVYFQSPNEDTTHCNKISVGNFSYEEPPQL